MHGYLYRQYITLLHVVQLQSKEPCRLDMWLSVRGESQIKILVYTCEDTEKEVTWARRFSQIYFW